MLLVSYCFETIMASYCHKMLRVSYNYNFEMLVASRGEMQIVFFKSV